MPHRAAACRTPTIPIRAPRSRPSSASQYIVARALADRAVRLEHFEGDAPFDPAIRELMARTTARPHPEIPENGPLQWGAEVVVTTRDGQRFASRLDDFERRGPGGQPMTTEELWEKCSASRSSSPAPWRTVP